METETNLFASYERQQLSAAERQYVLPCCLITGALGSGKTTLLSHLLSQRRNLRIGTLINDLGEQQLDELLVAGRRGGAAPDEMLTGGFSGACLCCSDTIRAGMEDSVWALLQRATELQEQSAAGTEGSAKMAAEVAREAREVTAHSASAAAAVAAKRKGKAVLDYLVIETSGVSDPGTVIDLLDQKFGRMTRARLDCVVTVVDTDALVHAIEEDLHHTLPITYERQIMRADVVVLNKLDLVERAKITDVERRIKELNEHAHIIESEFGIVPLEDILDVGIPESAGEVVSHEQDAGVAFVTSGGGRKRKPSSVREATAPSSSITATAASAAAAAATATDDTSSSSRNAKRARGDDGDGDTASAREQINGGGGGGGGGGDEGSNGEKANGEEQATKRQATSADGSDDKPTATALAGASGVHEHRHSHQHLSRDRMSVVDYESHVPIALAKFQDFITKSMPDTVLRAKGMVWFGEDPNEKFLFSVSGRRHFQLDTDGPWVGPPHTRLTFIGTDLDRDGITAALEAMHAQPQMGAAVISERWESAKAELATDPRFTIVLPPQSGHHHQSVFRHGWAEPPSSFADQAVPHRLLRFRFTCLEPLKLSEHELHVRYGVDLDKVNAALALAVNTAGGYRGACISCCKALVDADPADADDTGGQGRTHQVTALQFSLDGQALTFQDTWEIIREEAKKIAQRYFGHISNCHCGW